MEKKLCLRNKYWVLRHGKSIPNEKGLIVSFIVLLHIFLRILCLFISQLEIFYQENGIKEEYQLADEGVGFIQVNTRLFKVLCNNLVVEVSLTGVLGSFIGGGVACMRNKQYG